MFWDLLEESSCLITRLYLLNDNDNFDDDNVCELLSQCQLLYSTCICYENYLEMIICVNLSAICIRSNTSTDRVMNNPD